jgi:hypothetical protein
VENTRDFSSVRLATQDVMYLQRCIRQSTRRQFSLLCIKGMLQYPVFCSMELTYLLKVVILATEHNAWKRYTQIVN